MLNSFTSEKRSQHGLLCKINLTKESYAYIVSRDRSVSFLGASCITNVYYFIYGPSENSIRLLYRRLLLLLYVRVGTLPVKRMIFRDLLIEREHRILTGQYLTVTATAE